MDSIVEAAELLQLLGFLDELGVDRDSLNLDDYIESIREKPVGVPVSTRLCIDLLESAAELLERPDLGIAYARWLYARTTGIFDLPDEKGLAYADRITLSQGNLGRPESARTIERIDERNSVVVVNMPQSAIRPHSRQYAEAALALSVNNARRHFGSLWNPAWVEIRHGRPTSNAAQENFFGCPVRYESALDGWAIANADLYRPLKFSGRCRSGASGKVPIELRSRDAAFVLHVKALVKERLSDGSATLPAIASTLAMSERTFQRRLKREGRSFSDILSEVRGDVVLAHTSIPSRLPLTKLTELLGYSESSVVSRFMRMRRQKIEPG